MGPSEGGSVNLRGLAENLEMTEDEFLEMLDLFVEASSSDLRQLQSAAEEGDASKAIHAAHSIKGAAANLGLMKIYEVAKQTEMEARRNHLAGTAEIIEALEKELKQIVEILEARRQSIGCVQPLT